MKRVLWLVAFALLAGNSFSQEVPSWFSPSLLHLPEDVAEAAKEGKRVMLYFEQNGCPYCKRMVEVNFANPKIASRLQRQFVPVAINVWGDRELTTPEGRASTEKQFAAALKVQ